MTGVGGEGGGGAFERDPAHLEDIGVVGDREGGAGVLLDEEDRSAAGAQGR